MKLQIDTNAKVIRIEEAVNFYELCQMVKKLFPNDMWKEFNIETTVIQNWTSPIIIKEYPIYPVNPYPMNPLQPPFLPYIHCQSGIHTENGYGSHRTTYGLNPGVFNVDCQAKN